MQGHFSICIPIALLYITSSLTILAFSHGDSHIILSQPPAESEKESFIKGFSRSTSKRRFVAEAPVNGDPTIDNPPMAENPSVVLAAERTFRKDPLNDFQRYTGGWNISNHHYWASVSYTGAPLFAVAAAWFLGFGLCLLFICVSHFCSKQQSYGYSPTAYVLSLFCLILLAIFAIIGCAVLFTGQEKFHKRTSETLEYVVSQADGTVTQLRTISGYLASAKLTGVDEVFLPPNVQSDIDQIGSKLNSSADTISEKTTNKSDDIKDFLDSVRLVLIIISASMLLLTFLGLLFSIFGLQSLVYILVILGWLLVTGTFILSGTFLLLHNATSDTCFAMDQWVQNPSAHTAVDELLPCTDNATAQETIMRSKEVTTQLVDLINEVLTNVSNINFAPNFVPMYFNQSGPLVPLLCNPFHHDLTDRACSAGEVDLNNATSVWSSFVCQASPNGICTTTGRLTPKLYSETSSGISISNALLGDAAFLAELQDCSYARQTFSDITRDHCPGLRRYSRWIYTGLVMVSMAVMLSLAFWVVYGRERRHRLYAKEFVGEDYEEEQRQFK